MIAILVTGGAGYIGSHVCKALAAAGFTPVAYDNLSSGHRWAVRWGPLEVGEVTDSGGIGAALERHRIQAVVHLAGVAHVGESVAHPGLYYRINAVGTLGVLEAMLRHGVQRIAFSSTCATYGVPDRLPIGEDHRQDPVSPYGASKLFAERMLRDLAAAHGLRFTTLRYFNACGADPDGELGEAHDPQLRLIPRALMAAMGAIPHVEVFGTDYPTTDGTCVRDYIHVSDLANAHVRALTHLLADGPSMELNLGVGRGCSVGEILGAVERVTGRPVPMHLRPRRPGDPAELIADPGRAARVLGFAPRFGDIDAMVATAWRWFSHHHRRAATGETNGIIAAPPCLESTITTSPKRKPRQIQRDADADPDP